MRFHALACDYDGTIAHHGRVDAATIAALERVRDSGRKLLLVSGRHLEDLEQVCSRLDLFDRLVLENGAIVVDPLTRDVRTLADPPPLAFVDGLRARGVTPLAVGRAIVATWEPHEQTVLDLIREHGLELQVIFNKGAVMVLPSGVNKAFGLRAALTELGLSRHNVVGAGDAENDHAFLSVCECGVAVQNALPALKEIADWIAPADHGAGVRALVDELIRDDLRELTRKLPRHAFCLGAGTDGTPLTMQPHAAPAMIAGTSGAGKSTLATALLEQLGQSAYQYCVIDPEGDYTALEGAAVLGDAKRSPTVAEIVEVLADPERSVVANLLGTPLADRPTVFLGLFSRLLELRAQTGRPHWIVIDETHHMLPHTLDASVLPLPQQPHGLLLLTVHPESVSRPLLQTVGTLIAVGATPNETIGRFAEAIGEAAPDVPEEALPPGDAFAWFRDAGREATRFKATVSTSEHHRHVRKYAAGELGPDRSFYFRGPDGRLNLRAQNLEMFVQMAEGVDEATWAFHFDRGDVAQWFKDYIKDDELARTAEELRRDRHLSPAASRERVKDAIGRRYTAPA